MNSPTFREAFAVWTRIGCLSFGGPAAQIALMHREVVETRNWLSEKQYLDALAFCMMLPGPEAMQLATYAGWRLHGIRGGLAAGLMFVIPGAIMIMALAALYAAIGNIPIVAAVFLGIKAAVVAIVVEALAKVARRALTTTASWAIAAAAFFAIFVFAIPFPLIIAVAAILGVLSGLGTETKTHLSAAPPTWQSSLRTIVIWMAIWWAPALLLIGAPTIFLEIFFFFSNLAVVTFGGAYAVLAYMAQEVVTGRNWLSAGAMMDALGLAETTPGPLILVTQFVGFLAAHPLGWSAAILGALVTLWATFAPCFLWIFVGAPYIEWISGRPRLKAALAGITAAVVGVILNLSIWFALHVFFGTVSRERLGWWPDISTIQPVAVILALVAGYLLLVRHMPVAIVLAISAALGALTVPFQNLTGL